MANPPTGSGTDIETLKIGVDTSEASTGASDLDKLGVATVKVVKNIDELSVAVDKQSAALAKNTDLKNAANRANERANASEKEVLRLKAENAKYEQAAVDAGTAYIAKLEEMVATFNMTTAALQRYKAEQLGVLAEAAPLIAQMEEMAAATKRYGVVITEVAQIEAARVAWEEANITALNAQRIRSLDEIAAAEKAAQEKMMADATVFQAFKNRTMAENRAAAIKDINEMEAVRLADIEKQKADAIAFNAFKIRTMNENRAEANKTLIEQEKAAVALAEKQAIEEIKWNAMSVKARILELERLKAYQAESAIRPQTIEASFNSAAFKDLPNLEALIANYNETLTHTGKATRGATEATSGLSAALANNRVRTEAVVLGHEALQGRFTRMPGSMMVMMEYLSAANISLMGLGMSGLLAGAAVAAFVYEMYRGQAQSKAFNDSIFRTNNFAGETRSSMEDLAQSVGKLHGSYTSAYEAAAALNNTGKFTKDQLEMITSAVVNLEHAFGTKLNVSIKEFESLSVRGTSVAAAGNMQVSKALEKLDEQYHFVTVSLMEEVIQLEKEGKAREASRLAIEALAKESERASKQSVENIGWIESAWNGVTKAIKGVIQAMADVGKKSTDSNREQALINLLPKNKDGSLKTDENKMSQTDLMRYKQYMALEKELSNAAIEANRVSVETQQRSDAVHTLTLRAIEDKRLMKKSDDELQYALKKNAEENRVIELADPGYMERNAKYLSDREAAIIKDKTRKAKDDGRKSILADNIAASKAEYDQAKEAADQTEKMLKEWADAGQITRQTEYDSIAMARQNQLNALDAMKRAELVTLAKYKPLNDADGEANKKRINDVARSYELAAQKIKNATELAQQQVIDVAVGKATKDNDTELKNLESKIEKQKLYNAEIGKTDAQKAEAIKIQDDEKLAAEQVRLVYLETKVVKEQLGEVEFAVATAEIDKLKLIIADREKYNDLLRQGVALKQQEEIDKDFNRMSKKIGNDLASAIVDGGGRGLRRLIRDMELAFAKTILRPIIQPFADGFAAIFNPNASAAVGIGGASGTGGVGGAIGLATAATNAYKMLSNGFAGVGSSVASGAGSIIQGAGTFFGSSATASYGAGMAAAGGTDAAMYASAATSGNLSAGAAAGNATGSVIGSAAAVAAGVLAGVKLGSAISGDYGKNSYTNASTAIGTGVGYYVGGPWGAAAGAAIGGAIGGIVNRIFGMQEREVTSTGIRGTISDTGVIGQNYSNWQEKGGWFRSDKNGTETRNLTEDVVNSFTSGLVAMKAVTGDFAKTLGINTDALSSYSKDFDILLNPLKEVKGTATEQAAIKAENDKTIASNNDAITKFFTTVGDDLANRLIPNMSEFARVGETSSQTLERLNNTFVATNAIAAMLGMTAEKAFGGIGLASDAARERLINLAGGLDQLNALTSSYAQNFLSDAEKLVPAQKAVSAAMKEFGLSNITTKDQFKAKVESLKPGDVADAQLFINLMKVQDAFATVADGADKLAIAASALADSLFKTAMDNVTNAYNALNKSVTAEKTRLNTAYDLEVKAIQNNTDTLKTAAETRKKVAQDSLKDITTVFTSLQNSLKSVQIESVASDAARRRSAQAYLQDMVKQVQAGKSVASFPGLDGALADVSKDSKNSFSTFLDYARDQAKTINTISVLQEYSKTQMDYAQLTVDGITATIAAIESSGAAQLEAAKIAHDKEIAKQDAMLELAQTQIDVLNGINGALLSVAAALAGFNGAAAGATAQQVANSTGSKVQGIESLYQNLLGRASDPGGLQFWQDALNNGLSLSQISAGFTGSDEYKKLHPFADGANYIPKDMDARIHEGEAIIPKADNAELMSRLRNPSSTDRALIQEIQALRQEVRELRVSNSAENVAIQRDGAYTAKTMKRWEGNGMPATRITTLG